MGRGVAEGDGTAEGVGDGAADGDGVLVDGRVAAGEAVATVVVMGKGVAVAGGRAQRPARAMMRTPMTRTAHIRRAETNLRTCRVTADVRRRR